MNESDTGWRGKESGKGNRARVAVKCAKQGRFTGADQSKFYRTAYKATILSSALLDLSGGNRVEQIAMVTEGRELLRRVAAMLTVLSQAVTRKCHT